MREKQKKEREGSSRGGGRKGNDKGEDENKRDELVKKKKKKKQELIGPLSYPKSGRYSGYRTNWNSLNGSRNDSCQPSMYI